MIVFVIATVREASPVVANLNNVRASEERGRKIYRGEMCQNECAVLVCGVGKANAAAGTQYAIDILGADKIINAGVAGGLNRGTRVAEIYSVSECAQYDFDLAMINGTPVGTLNEFSKPYLPLRAAGGYPLKRLGTGDRFNDDERDFLLLTNALGADIRDMECGAIVQTCIHNGVPVYSFKAISDVAGMGSTGEQFENNLALCAQKLESEAKKIFLSVAGDNV